MISEQDIWREGCYCYLSIVLVSFWTFLGQNLSLQSVESIQTSERLNYIYITYIMELRVSKTIYVGLQYLGMFGCFIQSHDIAIFSTIILVYREFDSPPLCLNSPMLASSLPNKFSAELWRVCQSLPEFSKLCLYLDEGHCDIKLISTGIQG